MNAVETHSSSKEKDGECVSLCMDGVGGSLHPHGVYKQVWCAAVLFHVQKNVVLYRSALHHN